MARAHFVKSARKDYPSAGIKKGESYWWWKFRYGSKRMSKTQPTRSQLTQSAFYGQVYDLQDRIAGLEASDSLPDEVSDIADELRSLGEECSSNRDNMPEQLQDSDSGSLLQERADAMEAAADEFEGIDFDPPDEPEEPVREEDEDDEMFAVRVAEYEEEVEAYQNFWQEKLEEVQAIDFDVP